MKRNILSMAFVVSMLSAGAQEKFSRNDFISANPHYSATVEVTVTLPFSKDEVTYVAKAYSEPTDGDSLCAVKYLVEAFDGDKLTGFNAYYGGNYLVYTGGRFREYKYEQDSLPFVCPVPRYKTVKGVHKSGLHAVMIPALLSEQIKELSSNPENIVRCVNDTVIDGTCSSLLCIDEMIKGLKARSIEVLVSAKERMPLVYQQVSSPGTQGEQTIKVVFAPMVETFNISEQDLKTRYENILK